MQNDDDHSIEGADSILKATGQWPVYPGHPLVIAWEIMTTFPTPTAALGIDREFGLNCPNAVSDIRITGGGGEVHAACTLLQKAQAGAPAADLISWADARWTDSQAGGHVKNVQAGLEQAEKLKAGFGEKLAAWLAEDQAAARSQEVTKP